MAVAALRHAAAVLLAVALPRGGRAVALRPRRAALRQQAGAAALAVAPWLAPGAAAGATAAPYATGCNDRLPRTLVVRSEDVAATAAFFEKALGMATVSRAGDRAFVSFGPTAPSRPPDFYPGVSTLDADGGHFALEVVPAAAGGVAAPDADADAYVQLAARRGVVRRLSRKETGADPRRCRRSGTR